MLTPTGQDCKFYYQDFNRGRNRQECRLLLNTARGAAWDPRDCQTCPVPGILRANASEHLKLAGSLRKGFMGLGRKVEVTAYCDKHHVSIADPFVGCIECAEEGPNLNQFIVGSGL